MNSVLEQYKKEQERELQNILTYWMNHAIDVEHDGFYGKLDHENNVYPEAPKGSVLNSRILWTFSRAYNYSGNENHLSIAQRAYRYIINHFYDNENGGVYWSVDYKGKPLDTKKQIYALAFAIYGLSEYVLASRSEEAKKYAIDLYGAIEKYSHDQEHQGYIEALTKDWQEITDLRLSAKDANERKSMNTHLHVLEGYANLYRIWPAQKLKENIIELIHLFLSHIIDQRTNHLALFFGDNWEVRSHITSYGHDIEAAWLVQEAAEIIGEEELVNEVKKRSIKIAEAATEGLDKDGGLWYEYEIDQQHLIKEKHWWVQSEAMVGFFNAWQLSGREEFLNHSLNSWAFIKQHILHPNGEWAWGIHEDGTFMQGEDKVGLWKCPYHNSRACIEIIERIDSMSKINKL
jgi:cellobiose epimerase